MSERKGQRSLWKLLGLYAAGSWICLQVVDVLGQNIQLPSWAFSLTLILLLIGVPIMAATAYLQARTAYAGDDRGTRRGLEHRLLTWPNVVWGGVGAMGFWGIAVTAWLLLGRNEPSEGEVLANVEEIDRLTAASDFAAAYDLVASVDDRIRDDSLRAELWARVALSVTFESDPSGAHVSRRSYAPAGAEWEEIGRTPVTIDRFPLGQSRVRFELEGRRSREIATDAGSLAEFGIVELDSEEASPEGMVSVIARSGSDAYGLFAPGLEQVPNLALGEFLMADSEVTNREYATFVEAGGYGDPACWEHPFTEDGVSHSFRDAMARFTDATGRPGPATWDAGTYPTGQADLPVGGVSWYEAAAYACFAGMEPPTVYHWYAAANPFSSHHVVPLSNYGDEPAPVKLYEGVSRDGIYDLAGNVREWTRNANGESRFILGGGWADMEYAFNDAVTAPAFDRSPLNGIRLVQYADTTNVVAASAPMDLASGAIYRRSYDEIRADQIRFLLRSGRAVVFPIYKGTFERGTDLKSDIQDESNHWRDHVIAWTKDLRRSIDYLDTRGDIDMDRLGYMGISWGGAVAPMMLALEDRIRAVVIVVGGLLMQDTQPMADPFNFLPRVQQPTVMINARWDSFYPLETAGRPFFDNLGAPEGQRKLVIIDANHGVLSYARNEVVGEALDWLDTYLGPVR